MKILDIKNTKIGEGIPKIVVPLVGKNQDEIVKESEKLKNISFDIVEWRADFSDFYEDIEVIESTLISIRNNIGNKPILFTFRTSEEGGEKSIDPTDYLNLNNKVASLKLVDLIDVEIYREKFIVEEIISCCHQNEVRVIGSNHHFDKTPSKQEIIDTLKKMDEFNCDILKIAVMPKDKFDVLELLQATVESNLILDKPVVTMSMAKEGMISRLCGEVFGSCLTFGVGEKSSAPGQIEANDLKKVLEVIHKNL